jgi:3-hydroxyisobutyrate dehydrogenase-like beta-hydroxyacid dehydrogenase
MATITVIGAGAMGSAVGRRLAEGGATVLTFLEGRSTATLDRAKAAGMRPTTLTEAIGADLVMSIVPPAEALGVAKIVAAESLRLAKPVVFIDCNAIAPATMKQVAETCAGTPVEVIDGSIIGAPPRPGYDPKFYVSADSENQTRRLSDHGLVVRRIDGGIGAASALKMSYAGITKGMTGLGTAMMLGAIRNGADESLKREIAESVPDIDKRLSASIPDMYQKAYRWVAEMREIAEFLGPDDPAAQIFHGMAGVFEKMAADRDGDAVLAIQLDRLLAVKEGK